jgi:hypothetical protein
LLMPSCGPDGTCSSSVQTAPGTCNPATGKCESGPQQCKTACDCPQGSGCSRGVCLPIQPGAEVYCCSKPGCASGKACYNQDGTPGVCGAQGCTSSQDCPSASCRDVGTGCELSRPYCDPRTRQCNTTSGVVANATCRTTNGVGTCVPRTTQCKTSQDCGKVSCRMSGTICVQVAPLCSNGQCTSRSIGVRGAVCDASGVCSPSQACKVHCDCAQGQACVNGQCATPSGVRYLCCSKAGCVAGEACYNADNSKGTCARPPQCKTDAECKASSCSQSGAICSETSEKCVNGVCQGATSAQPGQCDGRTGKCNKATLCNRHCDCPQGEACQSSPLGGVCTKTSQPVYCCAKTGCPSGQRCVNQNNQAGTCPLVCSSPCDCPSGLDCVGTKCVAGTKPVYCCDNTQQCPAGQACRNKQNQTGTCPNTPRACKSVCDCVQGEGCVNGTCQAVANPTYCCDNPGCKSGAACVNKLGQNGVCPTTCKTHCDCKQGHACSQGVCSPNPAGAYCCSKPGCPSNLSCFTTTGGRGRCPVQTCTSACDCNQGEDCRNGQCTRVNPPVYCCSKTGCPSGQACKDTSGKWGTCQGAPACKSPCDCQQGRDCYKGQCIQVFPAVYCCSNVGCPAGQACFDSNNTAGVCPGSQCTTACDCPNQGQSCVRGRCTYTNPRTYCCSKPGCLSGQACEDSNGKAGTCGGRTCKTACDCNQGEDCRNGSCVRVSPPVYCCSKTGCRAGQACVKTDGTSSTCAVECRSQCDCQQGFRCVQGSCFRSSTGYCCDKTGCPTGRTCTTQSGQQSVCGGTPPPTTCKTRCDCNQGQDCQSGKCVTTPNRVYCCDKTGCPRGFACRDKSDQPGFCPSAP